MKQYLHHHAQSVGLLGLGAVLMTIKIFWLNNLLLGVVAVIILIIGMTWSKAGASERLRSVLSAFSLWLAVCLIAVYFYSFTPWSVFFGLLAVLGQQCLLLRNNSPERPISRRPLPKFRWRQFLSLDAVLLLIILLVAIIGIWQVRDVGNYHHLYQGLVTSNLPILFVTVPVLALAVLGFFRRSRWWLLGALALWFTLNSFYVTRLDTLYGADSWRHFGKIVRVDSGQPYQPTKLSEMIKLSNEKIPNASLYTIVPLMHRLTGLESQTIYQYSALFLFGPLLMILVYVAAGELTRRRTAAQLMVLAGFLAPGFYGVEGFLNVRTLGIVFLALNTWLWLRYCFQRYHTSWLEIIPITVVSILAYPTTGYISLLIAVLALTLKNFNGWKSRWPSLALTLILALGFSFVIPALDIGRMGIHVQPAYQHHIWKIIYIARDWFLGSVRVSDPVMSSFTLIYFLGLGWLWWKHHDRVFIIVGAISLAVMIDVWTLATFTERYAPFSSRMPMILSICMAIIFSLGLDRMVVLFSEKHRRFHQIVVVLIFAALIVKQNNPAAQAIGWTPSNNELQATQAVVRAAGSTSYRVLTDETTAAVGYAMAPKNETSWSWYPNNLLASTADQFVRTPTRPILLQACHISGLADRVYFIKTPIPPGSLITDAALQKVRDLMTFSGRFGDTEVYRYDCRKS